MHFNGVWQFVFRICFPFLWTQLQVRGPPPWKLHKSLGFAGKTLRFTQKQLKMSLSSPVLFHVCTVTSPNTE